MTYAMTDFNICHLLIVTTHGDWMVVWFPEAGLWADAGQLEVDGAHDHRAARIEGQVLKSPPAVEGPDAVVDRVGDDAETPYLPCGAHGCLQGEEQKRTRMNLALPIGTDGKLPQKRDRNGIRLVALVRLREKRAFYLCCAEANEADDFAGAGSQITLTRDTPAA
jgi:hypothetical protein